MFVLLNAKSFQHCSRKHFFQSVRQAERFLQTLLFRGILCRLASTDRFSRRCKLPCCAGQSCSRGLLCFD